MTLRPHEPGIRVDLYEVEMNIFFHDDKKVLTRLQRHGEIREENYVWGRDDKNRPVRKQLRLSLIVPRDHVREFKITVTQLDNILPSSIGYRKISTLI